MKKNHCAIHGEMTEENAYVCRNTNGTTRLRCKECCKIRRIEYYRKDPEAGIRKAAEWKSKNRNRINTQTREDRKANPGKYSQWSKNSYNKDPVLANDKEITRRLSMNREDYYQMFIDQQNKCAICNQEETRLLKGKRMRLCLDHNHKNGVIRELLCHACNTGIGKFKDSQELLQKAIDYLKKHEE